jgi:hypothetical protein
MSDPGLLAKRIGERKPSGNHRIALARCFERIALRHLQLARKHLLKRLLGVRLLLSEYRQCLLDLGCLVSQQVSLVQIHRRAAQLHPDFE